MTEFFSSFSVVLFDNDMKKNFLYDNINEKNHFRGTKKQSISQNLNFGGKIGFS